MIISNNQVKLVLKAQQEEIVEDNPTEESSPVINPLVSTLQGKIFIKIKKEVLKETNHRREKIAILKNLIRKGKYSPSSAEIAEKMITRSIVDEILKDEILK